MPKLTRSNDELQLALSGHPDFKFALDQVKCISGRRFDPETKLWKFPDEPAIAERILMMIKPAADASVLAWVRASRAEREQSLTTALPDDSKSPLFIPWAERLYDFQRAAVEFLVAHPKAILADDMGLGKTVQSLSAVSEFLIRNDGFDVSRPSLIICPNSAKGVWAREIEKWLGTDAPYQIVDAKTAKTRLPQIESAIRDSGYCIVNWEQVRASVETEEKIVHHRDGTESTREVHNLEPKQPLFRDTPWLAVIADEAHRAKNRNAAQTKGMWMLDAPMKIAATGTPLMNSPDELWALLKWLYPEQYGNSTPGHSRTPFWSFHDQFTESYDGYKGSKVVIGVKNPDGLRFELKDRLIRRTKAQKLHLPAKTREYVPLRMGAKQAAIYKDAETKFWLEITQAIKEGDKDAAKFAEQVVKGTKRIVEISNGAARTVRLRQVLCSPALLGADDTSVKLDAIVENIVDNSHQQHVVFFEFVRGANLLVDRLKKKNVVAEAYTGEVTDTRIRTLYEDRFQNGEIDVLCGTLGAMRESITLTAANIEHFSERAWVPGWNEQAEDRCHRVGQENPVTIYIYEVEDSVDTEKVRPTNELKEMIVSSVITKDEVAVT